MFLPVPGFQNEVYSSYHLEIRSGVAAGSDPADTGPGQQTSGSTPVTTPPGSDKPGPHRFIGVGMVVGLAFIVFLSWLSCASWPRRMAARLGCRTVIPSRRRKKSVAGESEAKLYPRSTDDSVSRPEKAKIREGKQPCRTSRQIGQAAGFDVNG